LIYVSFTVWLLAILFAGIGIYRLWARLTRPLWVNWALLPGTFVSEMSYIFGTLITGGEIRRVQLMPSGGQKGRGGDGEPVTEDAPRLKVVGPAVAGLTAVLGSLAALIALYSLLETPAIKEFVLSARLWIPGGKRGLPRELPADWDGFWRLAKYQFDLVKAMCESWVELPWLDWRVPLFVYLATCLSVRLAPVGRDLRWSLAAMALVALLIALAGLISDRFDGLIRDGDLWYFLTYVWTLLLLLLLATLVLSGLVTLAHILAGKSPTPRR
jgi:hypothetical protein